jgi:hypothetical protein
MGVLIPLVGVLFGYTSIFLKVRAVKAQIRLHQQSVLISRAAADASSQPEDEDTKKIKKKTRPQKPGFTHDDVKLAKTLFAAFLVFFICW